MPMTLTKMGNKYLSLGAGIVITELVIIAIYMIYSACLRYFKATKQKSLVSILDGSFVSTSKVNGNGRISKSMTTRFGNSAPNTPIHDNDDYHLLEGEESKE